MKCSSTVELLDTPFVYSFFFTVKFQVAAKGDDSILASKIVLHNTIPLHLNSGYLTLLYQCAILLQELLSPIPLNICFPTITWLPDFYFFFSLTSSFLNKLTIDQLNIMQVSTLSNPL